MNFALKLLYQQQDRSIDIVELSELTSWLKLFHDDVS